MKPRKTLIAANWKMYKTVGEAVSFVQSMENEIPLLDDRDIVIAPPYTVLPAVRAVMTRADCKLAAQNCHWEDQGAYTGEISCAMLQDVGCDCVIIGHSERRHIFGETDEWVRRKLNAAVKRGLMPILCIGERLPERENGRTFPVVENQLQAALAEVAPAMARQLVIAYEPVWAIGTGKTATPGQAQEVHRIIREKLTTTYDKDVANTIRILYGGSVKPDNVDALMAEPDIDGLLVGGASLEVASFKRIVQYR